MTKFHEVVERNGEASELFFQHGEMSELFSLRIFIIRQVNTKKIVMGVPGRGAKFAFSLILEIGPSYTEKDIFILFKNINKKKTFF